MALAKPVTGSGKLGAAGGARTQGQGLPLASLILGVLSAISLAVTFWLIFFYTPIDALQGVAQRIFYIHVPTAWAGMFSFVLMAALGIIYLIKPYEPLDLLARAAAEVGVVFLTITLILGSLWGRPIWGAWWVWDPRLTATLIMWFMYIGYLMLRSYYGRNHDSGRVGAVVGIIGAIDVPIIYLSVAWWRGQHPTQEIGASGALPPQALLTFAVAMVAFSLLYAFLMLQAYQLQRLQMVAQRLRETVSEEE
jgi:heme exporter protein C